MDNEEVVLIERNNEILTSSLDVADKFDRRHEHIIRSIEKLIEGLPKSGDTQKFFIKTEYINKQNNQSYTMYFMNRDGFSLLVMGLNNTPKVLEWKLKYIQAFNKMEQAIRSGVIEIGYEQRMKANLFDNIEGQKLKWLTNKEIVEKNYERRGAYSLEDVKLFFNLRQGQFTRYMKEHNFNERTFPNCFTSYWSETTTSKPLLGITKDGMNYIGQHLEEIQNQLLPHSK